MADPAIDWHPIVSSWLSAIALVNGELAVKYVNGFTCVYTGAGQDVYDALLVSDAGRFVRQFLYRQPYRAL